MKLWTFSMESEFFGKYGGNLKQGGNASLPQRGWTPLSPRTNCEILNEQHSWLHRCPSTSHDRSEAITAKCDIRVHLKFSTQTFIAPKNAKSWEPAQSEVLSQNIINRQQVEISSRSISKVVNHAVGWLKRIVFMWWRSPHLQKFWNNWATAGLK